MTDFPDWQSHEKEVAELLGIDQTVTSGNKFYDISDATTREHVLDNKIQLLSDMKSTIRKTFRMDREFLKEYRERAMIRGKIFVMPVRFENQDTKETEDWIVLQINDFSELLGLDLRNESVERKAMLEQREKNIVSKLKAVSTKLEDLLSDKTINNNSRRTLLEGLDVIDDLYFDLINRNAR